MVPIPRGCRATAFLAALALAACDPGAAPPQSFDVAWGGDVLLGDAAEPALNENGFTWPFERIRDLIDADYLVVNLEGPITSESEPYFPDQEFSYNADPEAAAALAVLGVDAVSLSNNHTLDRGSDGLRDTIEHLTDAGVSPFGAGTVDDALAPHMVETPYGTLAVVGLSSRWTYGAEASTTEVGTVAITPESVARAHELATDAGARWVVAFVHWGENYSGVTQQQRSWAQLFAGEGYDLVIGHHPHVPQEIDIVDGMPVLYSLGNLAFGTPGRFDPGEGYGLIATTSFGPEGVAIEVACIVTDNETVGYQPEPCAAAEAARVFGGLGPHVRADGQRAIVGPP